jgi:KaiC/GvpD/RAD55 family RecA-like ATPase
MDRIPTFIEGFDDVLEGGVPRGNVVLLCGTPGTMKTSLAFSILYHNVKERGAKGLFISLEEGHDELRAGMMRLGMAGLDDLELYILDVSRIRLEHKEEELSRNWLDILTKYISQRVQTNGFDLIALDSLGALYSLSRLENPRRDLFHFFGFLKTLGATSFLVTEVPYGTDRMTPYDEEFLADGILFLDQHDVGERDVKLRIRCVKMRRTRHEHGYFALLHRKGRFAVARAIKA